MLLFTTIMIMLSALVIAFLITTFVGGSMFLMVFGDVVVCVGLFWLIIKRLIKRD